MADFSIIKLEGKPLQKLVDVIGKAFGKHYKPKEIRRNADAEAYRIITIQKAETEAKTENEKAQFELSLEIQERTNHIERIRQINLENINILAAIQLKEELIVSDKPLEDDWIRRFYNSAQDISDSEMQKLWAKILSEEIKEPKSFSLRTLEILKNLSKKEAEIFSKIAKTRLTTPNSDFIINVKKGSLLNKLFGITFSDFLLMREIGLMTPSEAAFAFNDTKKGSKRQIRLANKILHIERRKKGKFININCYPFSRSGEELCKLIQPFYNEKYAKRIFKEIKKHDKSLKFSVGDFVGVSKGVIEGENLKEVLSK